MRYHALAADYDGTLATHGRVDEQTLQALERLLASDRKLVLVTGRTLDDLRSVCPHLHLFHRIVAENGLTVFRPESREEKCLGGPPPDEFVRELQRRGVFPLSVGRAIVATREPHENTVLDVIRDLGLELQVIFNKGAVMVLPAGVNKATGLLAALLDLGLSRHSVVGVGDAENDHAFLDMCECAVAVANALPMLKERADWVTAAGHGDGVREVIDALLSDDLRAVEDRLTRHRIVVGTAQTGDQLDLSPYGPKVLVTGSSGSGKSTIATGLLERIAERGYQVCVIDPEGDYEAFEGAVTLGSSRHAPTVHEIVQLLEHPDSNAVVNLIGLPLQDRPAFFISLLARLQELRLQTGRPHWIAVDEAHHLLPAAKDPEALTLFRELYSMLFVTVHPDQIASPVLSSIDTAVLVGEPVEPLLKMLSGRDEPLPSERATLQTGEALFWRLRHGAPIRVRVAESRSERRRHRRKYADGELGPDRSFYFRGKDQRLNLRAQNLTLFLQLAEGVDDETWMYHLHRGDYSRWLRDAIKDDAIAGQVALIEATPHVDPAKSRSLVKNAIEEQYTLPATGIVSPPRDK